MHRRICQKAGGKSRNAAALPCRKAAQIATPPLDVFAARPSVVLLLPADQPCVVLQRSAGTRQETSGFSTSRRVPTSAPCSRASTSIFALLLRAPLPSARSTRRLQQDRHK